MLAAHDRISCLNINNQKNMQLKHNTLQKLTPRFVTMHAARVPYVKKLNLSPSSDFYPRQGRQNVISLNFTTTTSTFCCHKKIISSKRDFSKTHRQTQRIYFWIGLDLTEVGKLLRSQTNSQILRNLHFCDQETKNFDKHV